MIGRFTFDDLERVWFGRRESSRRAPSNLSFPEAVSHM